MADTIMHQDVGDQGLTPEDHLRRDWELFQDVDAGTASHLCRTWETPQPVVVIGHSGSIDDHVFPEACREDGVRVLRRFTGGGAVVLGPGCLNYAVGLSLVSLPQLWHVAGSFRVILGRLVAALELPGLSLGGGTDLALNGRKVSGNAQRRGQRALIHHGTLLYDFDARLADRYLKEPRRQPAYRAARRHTEFLGNLPLSADVLRVRLAAAWDDPWRRSGSWRRRPDVCIMTQMFGSATACVADAAEPHGPPGSSGE